MGLTILKLSNCGIKNINNIRQLVNLVELDLNSNQNIDVSPLSELKQLTNLDLGRCNIKSTFTIQKLENLDELLLYGNQDIDITSLQFLKKLKVLNLNACNLQNIDMLQTLVYLQKLYISDNQIMYIQPIQELKQLSQLYIENNIIIDIQTIEKHVNFDCYVLNDQQQPTQRQISLANKLRSIHLPRTAAQLMTKNYITFKQNIAQYLEDLDRCLQQIFEEQDFFVEQVTSLFQNLNTKADFQ
ncbi:Conserved_hypothetical protein [Hexamita inflata]|uniref:Uncharacterized protein n=1 Tax=Hexamita inflata TaxID=28002 RepID=A0AA86QMP2_9EUKA|nr:Conserved hypothetical protein [Hexamita inflata]